ncbi:hypothetical protein EWM64_g9621, partial [Hericium alpestre]
MVRSILTSIIAPIDASCTLSERVHWHCQRWERLPRCYASLWFCKAGADAISSNGQAGSVSGGSPISGITHLHDDGTGGGSSLGNFKILSVYCDISGHGKTCITNETTRALSHGLISVSPDYFSISLAGSISAEMNVMRHAALHHITYHDVFAFGPPALLVDLTSDGMHSFSNGSIHIVKLPSQGHHRHAGKLQPISRASVDWGTAFEVVVKDATVQPPDWNLDGRNGLKSRAALHYVPKDDTTDPTSGGAPDLAASHTLEYAYNDFSIALLANGLGKQDEYAHYLNASRDWENTWDASVENTGFTGSIQAHFT